MVEIQAQKNFHCVSYIDKYIYSYTINHHEQIYSATKCLIKLVMYGNEINLI